MSTSHGRREDAALDATAALVRACGRRRPSDLADLVVEQAAASWGAEKVVLYLVTHEQTDLVPVPSTLSPRATARPVDAGRGAGRCFAEAAQVRAGKRLWTCVHHGAERIGVLEMMLPEPLTPEVAAEVEQFAQAVGSAVATTQVYSDDVEAVRRTQEMSLGAELLWSVLRPPSYATAEVEIEVMLEPTYSSGGDAFDYAVNGDIVHLLVLDAMGHGFPAASLSTVAVAAYRHSRRTGLDLPATLKAMDALVGGQFESTFATAVLAELDTTTGRLCWVSAGHPAPLVVRGSAGVQVLEGDPAPPLGVGLGLGAATVQEDYLEVGDLLVLYTDGVTEGRHLDGTLVGEDAFADLLATEAAVVRPLNETMRQVRRQLLAAEDAWRSDDTTAMLVRWAAASAASDPD